LVHLLKSVELLLNRGCVFYIVRRLSQPLFLKNLSKPESKTDFNFFNQFKWLNPRDSPFGCLPQKWCAFYMESTPCQLLI
jgi:hypothetical protein